MKIAAAYITSEAGNITANLLEVRRMLYRIEKQKVAFVLFPELTISGYITSKDELNAVWQHKEQVFDQLCELSRNLNTAFALGFPEKRGPDFYISHFIFEKGKIIGVHQKSHLGPTETNNYRTGDKLSVFQIGELNIGIQLCFETHFPEISYAQARQGANLLAMGFASPKETGVTKLERLKKILCARAYDNACYVLACNLAGTTSHGTLLHGLAAIIDPKGNTLAETTNAENGYCTAEFNKDNLKRIYQSKMAWFNRFKRTDFLKYFYE